MAAVQPLDAPTSPPAKGAIGAPAAGAIGGTGVGAPSGDSSVSSPADAAQQSAPAAGESAPAAVPPLPTLPPSRVDPEWLAVLDAVAINPALVNAFAPLAGDVLRRWRVQGGDGAETSRVASPGRVFWWPASTRIGGADAPSSGPAGSPARHTPSPGFPARHASTAAHPNAPLPLQRSVHLPATEDAAYPGDASAQPQSPWTPMDAVLAAEPSSGFVAPVGGFAEGPGGSLGSSAVPSAGNIAAHAGSESESLGTPAGSALHFARPSPAEGQRAAATTAPPAGERSATTLEPGAAVPQAGDFADRFRAAASGAAVSPSVAPGSPWARPVERVNPVTLRSVTPPPGPAARRAEAPGLLGHLVEMVRQATGLPIAGADTWSTRWLTQTAARVEPMVRDLLDHAPHLTTGQLPWEPVALEHGPEHGVDDGAASARPPVAAPLGSMPAWLREAVTSAAAEIMPSLAESSRPGEAALPPHLAEAFQVVPPAAAASLSAGHEGGPTTAEPNGSLWSPVAMDDPTALGRARDLSDGDVAHVLASLPTAMREAVLAGRALPTDMAAEAARRVASEVRSLFAATEPVAALSPASGRAPAATVHAPGALSFGELSRVLAPTLVASGSGAQHAPGGPASGGNGAPARAHPGGAGSASSGAGSVSMAFSAHSGDNPSYSGDAQPVGAAPSVQYAHVQRALDLEAGSEPGGEAEMQPMDAMSQQEFNLLAERVYESIRWRLSAERERVRPWEF